MLEDLEAEDMIKLKNMDIPIWKIKGHYRKKAEKRINMPLGKL
jgi:hypothetical protein